MRLEAGARGREGVAGISAESSMATPSSLDLVRVSCTPSKMLSLQDDNTLEGSLPPTTAFRSHGFPFSQVQVDKSH